MLVGLFRFFCVNFVLNSETFPLDQILRLSEMYPSEDSPSTAKPLYEDNLSEIIDRENPLKGLGHPIKIVWEHEYDEMRRTDYDFRKASFAIVEFHLSKRFKMTYDKRRSVDVEWNTLPSG